MATMIRKQIYIEPEQEAQLKQVAHQLGVSEAEVIRRAINLHLSELKDARQAAKRWEEEVAFMRSRIGLTPTGNGQSGPRIEAWRKELEYIRNLMALGPVEGGRTWRREDLYE